MSGRSPDQIWEEGVDEGERRLKRSRVGLAATGFAGGAEVALGILAVVVVSGAVQTVAPQQLAHVVGAMFFGIAFVLITLGRAELFTENFHIPVAAVYARRAPFSALLRMWAITLVFNLVGLAVVLGLMAVTGVLKPETVQASGPLADSYSQRDAVAAFASAILAGAVMTIFTWVVAAAEASASRVIASLLIGFLLIAPSLNHAIVSFGEIMFGLFSGQGQSTAADLWRNLGLAIAGNLIGGIGLVFATRVAQVRGEPDAESGRRPTDEALRRA